VVRAGARGWQDASRAYGSVKLERAPCASALGVSAADAVKVAIVAELIGPAACGYLPVEWLG
jgi:hypothetical protein